MTKILKQLFFPILLAGFLLTGCTQEPTTPPAESTTQTQSAQESTQQPYILTFEATTIDGEAISSEQFADSKLTMINAWATYCNPCLSEMPDLGEIASEYDPADFQLWGIICDVDEAAKEADIEEAKALIDETAAHYPHLLLNESLYTNLVSAISAVPTTFFFTQEGELLGYVQGSRAKETWTDLIDQLLSEME